MVGVILGIVAGSETGSSTNPTRIQDLRIASVVIFLFLTLVQALQTGILATSSVSGMLSDYSNPWAELLTPSPGQSQYYIRGKDSLGIRYGNFILLIISFLLIIREVFSVATVTNAAKQDNEHLWYPFIALPEILVVMLYVTPGLVPKRDELQQHSTEGKTVPDTTA